MSVAAARREARAITGTIPNRERRGAYGDIRRVARQIDVSKGVNNATSDGYQIYRDALKSAQKDGQAHTATSRNFTPPSALSRNDYRSIKAIAAEMGVSRDFILVWFPEKWNCEKWWQATNVKAPLWDANPDPRMGYTDKQCESVMELVNEVSFSPAYNARYDDLRRVYLIR